jgi:hypothetical protein
MGFFQTSGILNRRGFFGGASAAFDPKSISGLKLWLDGTVGLFDATTGGNAVTTNDSAVARWEDQSGNSNHALQATLNNRPVLKTALLNGKNVLSFDGSNDRMSVTEIDFGASPAYTIFTVKYQDAEAFRIYLAASNIEPYLSARDNAAGGFTHWNGASHLHSSFTSAQLWQLFTYSQDSSNRRFYKDNGSAVTGTASTRTAKIRDVGFGAGSFHWNGDLAEILIYDSYLSDSNRESVRDYLNKKWAIY